MPTNNFRLMCAALGFTAVIMKSRASKEKQAENAVAFAKMIEEFCRVTNPALFAPETTPNDTKELDRKIEELKTQNVHLGHLAGLAGDRDLLCQLYDRLLHRQRAYATDEMIAGEVAHLLEEEINHKAEADMMIVRVQGDEDIFSPCERMATAITEILKDKGECVAADLIAKGFTLEEVKLHWRMAYGLAKVELNWMDS